MNKKGLTLIELLAAIIILAAVGLITTVTVTESVKNSKQTAYNTNVSSVVEAAKKWAVTNNNLLPIDDSEYKVSIETLIKSGHIANLNNGKLINPIDNSTMEGCVIIKYNESFNQYIYEYSETC